MLVTLNNTKLKSPRALARVKVVIFKIQLMESYEPIVIKGAAVVIIPQQEDGSNEYTQRDLLKYYYLLLTNYILDGGSGKTAEN